MNFLKILLLNFALKNRCEQDTLLPTPSGLFLLANAVADRFDFVTG
ncbi:MAG: hypothetical protein ACBR18_02750 [Microcoleus sp.]